MPRLPYGTNMLYPGMFNGFSQQYGISPSGRSSASNGGNTAGNTITRETLAAAQIAAQQQAVYEAIANAGVFDVHSLAYPGQNPLGHQQPIANTFNKM